MLTVAQAFALALQHHQAGRLAEAEALYRQILAVQPQHAGTLHLLGVIAHQAGHHEQAVRLMGQAIALNPQDPMIHSNLGEAQRVLGRFEDAAASFQRAIALQPDYPEAHCNLGNVLREKGLAEEAVTACRRALELRPDYAVAHSALGNALRDRGQIEEAIAAYRQAVALQPAYPEAYSNLGNALRERGEFEEACAACRRALELRPDYAAARNNLGNALKDRGQIDEAISAYRQALELQPDYLEAHSNLGHAFLDRGEVDAAIASFRRALACGPQRAAIHSNLIYALLFATDRHSAPIAEEQRSWNQLFGEPAKVFRRAHTNARAEERRLRIGYVSPDFWQHAAGRNVWPLFRCHQHRDFEIICYSGVIQPDDMTELFQAQADQWRHVTGLKNEALAEMIRRDGVDILVDLSQHTAGNRLPVFARQPAPVQVSFAGYPDTAGVEGIGYRISDAWLEQCGMPEAGTERVFLIDSFWCYDSCGVKIAVNALPASESGRVTFGSLNKFCKVNPPLLRLWARVLKGVKDSRLVMLSGLGSHRQSTLGFLEREGITADRVEFVERCSRREYFELYHRLDAVLDTFPYNGHTTSLDALWMGLPVVSLAGQTRVSRGGLSVLSNLGLPELVAQSEDEYVEIAARLAGDLSRLAELRRTLRARMEGSVLMDAPRFARNIETAYRAMWRHWCAQAAR